jgi:hypothetical protein
MTSNEGRMRHGKPGPVSGAKIYSLRGKLVGTLPKGCYDGKFIGRIFIAKRVGGGVAAYQAADAKEVWLNRTLSAGDIRDSGAGLVILTKYDHKLRVYHNAVLDAASGKVMFKLSGEKGERVSILLATRKRYITLKGKAGNRGAAGWSSEILSAKGKSLGRIHWKGLPHTASFSPDGNKVGAVCYSPPRATGDAETKKVKWTAYIYTLDGKILAERQVGECEWKELATQMRVSHTLRFDSDGLAVTQKRVFSPLSIKSSGAGTSNTKTIIKLRTPRETKEERAAQRPFAKLRGRDWHLLAKGKSYSVHLFAGGVSGHSGGCVISHTSHDSGKIAWLYCSGISPQPTRRITYVYKRMCGILVDGDRLFAAVYRSPRFITDDHDQRPERHFRKFLNKRSLAGRFGLLVFSVQTGKLLGQYDFTQKASDNRFSAFITKSHDYHGIKVAHHQGNPLAPIGYGPLKKTESGVVCFGYSFEVKDGKLEAVVPGKGKSQ